MYMVVFVTFFMFFIPLEVSLRYAIDIVLA